MNKAFNLIALFLILSLPIALAVEFDQEITPEDQAAFDNILSPVMKIYNFIKYAATVLAVVFLVFAGISFIMSGSDAGKREQAKTTATYIVIGLMVIWVAPLVVQYMVG